MVTESIGAFNDPGDRRPAHRHLNNLTGKEWTPLGRSVITSKQVSSPREPHHKLHGATFPVALAERAIRMYSKVGDLVMDPFAGTGSTIIAAQGMGRRAVGFELYGKFCDIGRTLLQAKLPAAAGSGPDCTIMEGDCRKLVNEQMEPASVQLTFTSPPYANFISNSRRDRRTAHKRSMIEHDNNSTVKEYGNNPADFGNMDYADFLGEAEQVMHAIHAVTVDGGYNVWVVKDHRLAKAGIPFISVHSDIMDAGRRAGFTPHDLIVWDQNDQRSLVLLGYPTTFYVNINHSYLVVMRKR